MSTSLAWHGKWPEAGHVGPGGDGETLSVDELVAAAQSGNAGARNSLIVQHLSFIQGVATRVAKRPVATDEDLWSVALMAFNEAIDTYKESGRASFRTFASTVISRRLIDRFRRRSRRRDVPLTLFDVETEEGDCYNPITIREAQRRHALLEQGMDLGYEVAAYRQALAAYGVELEELVESSPSQQGARQRACQVADLLIEDEECLRYFVAQKKLPLKQLAVMPDNPVSRQTMERNRAYIVAIAVMKLGDFRQLLTFIED